MNNYRQTRIIAAAIFVLLITLPGASAFCLFGLGNTCGDDSSTPQVDNGNLFDKAGNWFKRNFNFEPAGSGSPSGNSNRELRRDYEDDGGYTPGRYELYSDADADIDLSLEDVYDTSNFGTDAQYYDVDVKDIGLECINCRVTSDGVQETAGFTYRVKINLFNHGNAPAEALEAKITIEETKNKYSWTFKDGTSLFLPPADYSLDVILKGEAGFGSDGKPYSEAISYDGREPTFPMTVKVELFNDDGVTQVDRRTFFLSNGETRTIYVCPDGQQLPSANPDRCDFDDPRNQDSKEKVFAIKKLTPAIAGVSDFDFPNR